MNQMNLEQARYNMIEQQIRPWDVLDDQVLGVLSVTPREDFVPPQYSALAFSDISIPIGNDQYMMPPKLEGKLLQSLAIRPTDSILEIGTGSAYLTACLARIGQSVHSVDLFADFTRLRAKSWPGTPSTMSRWRPVTRPPAGTATIAMTLSR